MNYIEFENLLGKHISYAQEFFDYDFKKSSENNFYINKDIFEKDYYGVSYNFLTIETDNKGFIKSITIHFKEIINQQFYNSFSQNYGDPNAIQVIEKREIVSESVFEKDGFTQNLKKSELTLREGKFEENPLYIIWDKEGFKIKAILRHKQGVSELIWFR